ncbi:choice-of-anchor D domain-containing protein [Leptospira licerasiae]|uniref:choice-of-anchor D domain-containing protein n=1 Tax=Leptospira licerasiae TaxID=447106 RepID=UPI00301B0F10
MKIFRYRYSTLLVVLFIILNDCSPSGSSLDGLAVAAAAMSGANFGQAPSKAEIGVESESIELLRGSTLTMPSVVVNTLGNLIPIKIRNTGVSKLTIHSIRLSGGNFGEYSLDLSGFTNTIEPNSSSDFYIRFRPLSVGLKQTVIVIQSNDANESTYKFNIHSQAQATPNPEIFLLMGTSSVLDGDSINLGSVSTCSNGRDYSFSIRNIGTSPLALSGTPIVDVSGIDPTYFAVVSQPSVSSIPVGGSVDFKIHFTPSGTSPRSAKISIPTDDADETNFSFNLNTAIGSPEIELSEFKVGGAVIPSGSAYYMGYSALNKKDTGAGFTQNDCSSSLELLLYDRKTGVFDFKKGTTFTESVLTGFNPETNGIVTINNGKPDRYTVNSRDEVLFFGDFGTTSKFFVVT